MNIKYRNLTLALAMVGLSATGNLVAQEQFPAADSNPASCDSMDWHKDMLDQYPRVIDACQEVVSAKDGSKWARFDSAFGRQESDGTLVFSIQGADNQRIEEVTLVPGFDQVAIIDGRRTEFRDLRNGQVLNLYVPAGGTGFTTEVGVASDESTSAVTVDEYGSSASSYGDTDKATASVRSPDANQSDQQAGNLDNVQFALDSAELSPAAKLVLDKHAREFSSNADKKYLISGHASASASQEYNQALSERRARAVMDYLVDVGQVDAGHLSMVGYGEMRPIASEASNGASNSKEAMANMRVGFNIA